MDGLGFDLMEPLSYCEEDEDLEILKSGRKRSGTDIEVPSSRTSKRQRVKSPIISQAHLDSFEDSALIIDLGSEITTNGSGEDVFEDPVILNKNQPCVQAIINVENKKDKVSSSTSRSDNTDNTDLTKTNVRYRRVLKRIPQDIPYLPITCEDGSRLYLRLKEVSADPDEGDMSLMCGASKRNLINDWDRVKLEARVLKDKFHRELAKTVANGIALSNDGENKSTEMPDSLWVEKYKPRSFLDLLSQEAVNKALLHWIKLWDKSVFGVDYLAKVKATRQKYAKLEAEEKEKDEKYHRKSYLPSNEEYDEGGRPLMKVALLSGDPGLGKTTCAHIIAKHAGYKIRELNASDDRSIEIFRKVLDDTTQSRSEIFIEGRPNCLVIDEIDGAPLASVNVLVELITGNATEAGKKKAKKFLRRPVICICNDLFAPSLKTLRKNAYIVQFPSVSVPRLVERLNDVSNREKLYIDSNTIQTLCQKAECDIRSCLSTLQFLKMRRYTSKDAIFSQVGLKDKSKGIFAVWSDIFTLPLEKRYQDSHPDPSKPDMRFRNILRIVQNFGEYDKLLGGVHHNYLNSKFRDSYLQSVIDGLEWTTWFEDIRGYVERTQTYAMYGYLPMYFVMAHFLYARKDPLRPAFPTLELSSKAPKFRQTIQSQIGETSPAVARFLDPHMLITDIFPSILNIIQPCNIRPVPTQIWTQRERDTLKNVVEVMLTYNLSYIQTRNTETGSYFFQIEPDLEEMVKFKLQDASVSKKPFPYAIKQQIAREIETEKLRRNDTMPEIVQKESFKLPETPKHSLPKSKSLEVFNKIPVIVARDFFGRPILPSADATSPETDTKTKESVPVYFRFKEGFSNAVRRYVKMRDLS